MLETHTYLHPSQTVQTQKILSVCLRPIHIYILLKQSTSMIIQRVCLRPIHIYILLKQRPNPKSFGMSLRPIHIYILLKPQIRKGTPSPVNMMSISNLNFTFIEIINVFDSIIICWAFVFNQKNKRRVFLCFLSQFFNLFYRQKTTQMEKDKHFDS